METKAQVNMKKIGPIILRKYAMPDKKISFTLWTSSVINLLRIIHATDPTADFSDIFNCRNNESQNLKDERGMLIKELRYVDADCNTKFDQAIKAIRKQLPSEVLAFIESQHDSDNAIKGLRKRLGMLKANRFTGTVHEFDIIKP